MNDNATMTIDNARAELMTALSHLRESRERWNDRMRVALRCVGNAAREVGSARDSLDAARLMVERARATDDDGERLRALDAALWHLFDADADADGSER